MLQLKNVAQQYGDHTVFTEVNLTLQAGERLALIGENGSGKTTLLRLLAGLDTPSAGQVSGVGRVAYLPQQTQAGAGRVQDLVMPEPLRLAQHRLAQATDALASGSQAALEAFAEGEEHYRALGGYDFEVRAAAVLSGLDLPAQAHASELSGGQMRRALLARLLLLPAEVYLLDEPTNHLDAAAAHWLEGWMVTSGAAFVIASHDRALLDATATRVAELERGRLHLYAGNYSQAMQQKETLRAAQQRDHEAHRRKRSALEEEKGRLKSAGQSADKFSHARAGNVPLLTAKNKAQNVANTLAGRARALERRLERLDEAATAKPYQDNRQLRLELPPIAPGPGEVLRVKDLGVWRGEKRIISGLDLHLTRGEKVALTGPNGAGKSTLLSALQGQLPHSGEVVWGAGLSLYTLGQHAEELQGLETVADALLSANPALTPHQLYEVAAQLGLPAPSTPISTLSGGQRTRLSLARLGVTRAQVLLLDEPTNHLDIHAIATLEEMLRAYSGTVLLASHDRRLIERVCTREVALGM